MLKLFETCDKSYAHFVIPNPTLVTFVVLQIVTGVPFSQ